MPAALLLLACVGVVALALRLRPDPRGYGTHQQLGMGACGMLISTGLPCPTCGMTTAFSYTVRGQLGRALIAQPGGLILALAAIALIPVSAWTVATGRAPRRLIGAFDAPRIFWILLIVLVGGWAFKLGWGLADGSLPLRSVRVACACAEVRHG